MAQKRPAAKNSLIPAMQYGRWDSRQTAGSSEAEQLYAASDGMLVRPILVDKDVVLIGFKESEWEKGLIK